MATVVLCPKCDKQEGIVPCLGCKKIFCVKHFQIHRQELSVQLENVVTRRNTLQEYYFNSIAENFEPTKLNAWNSIDEWERKMKEEVGKAADNARKQLDIFSKESRQHIEQKLNQITVDIQRKMERENFFEDDVEKLSGQIDEIEHGLQNNEYKPQIEINIQPIDWNASIHVKHLVKDKQVNEKQEKASVPLVATVTEPVASLSKPKYPPSIQQKCYACGSDTWQKPCKCCNHTYCGWHLKRHALELKKH